MYHCHILSLVFSGRYSCAVGLTNPIYTHTKNHKDYQFRMVYFKEGNTAVEFRLETTRATYPQMEEEFLSILKSMKF